MRTGTRRAGAGAVVCWTLLLGLQSAHASSQRDSPERLAEGRNREDIHPGKPIDVVGVAEGDNDFRSRTPVLQRSNHAVVLVDPDVQYQRRLAMYELGATYDSQPPTVERARWSDTPPSRIEVLRRTKRVGEDAARDEASRGGGWVLAGAVGLLVAAWVALRRGQMLS